jgi:hypothetical protein
MGLLALSSTVDRVHSAGNLSSALLKLIAKNEKKEEHEAITVETVNSCPSSLKVMKAKPTG